MSVNIDNDIVDVISCVALSYEKGKSVNSFLRKEKFRAQLPRQEKTLGAFSIRFFMGNCKQQTAKCHVTTALRSRLQFAVHV